MTLSQLSRQSRGLPLAIRWRSQGGLEHTSLRSPVLSAVDALLMQHDRRRGSWVDHQVGKHVNHWSELEEQQADFHAYKVKAINLPKIWIPVGR